MSKTLWPKASPRRVAKSLEAHAVIALAVSSLIYILVITGTLSVFNHEFQRWEQPRAPEMLDIAPEAAERAALSVFNGEDEPSTHLFINFPQPDLPRTVITTDTQAFIVDADGSIWGDERFVWTQFLLDLHYYLHLPHVLGLTVVGALGVMLIGLSLSGFMAHPRIFRDAFTLRQGAGRLTLADLHNRLSVWTAPFHVSNALTGAILGLATVLAFALAAARFEGDFQQVFSPVFGNEPILTSKAGEVADIDTALTHFRAEFPNLELIHAIVHDPATTGQHTQLIAEHPTRLIFGDYYNYDADGLYLGNTGISDGTLGQQIAGSVYNVHFGNWGGLPIKLVYGVFGVMLSVITASGLGIYFTKRLEKGRAAPRLEGAWEGMIWGVPLALAITLLGAVGLSASAFVLVPSFWITTLGSSVYGAMALKLQTRKALQRMTSIGITAAVLVHTMRFGADSLTTAALPLSLALLAAAAGFGAPFLARRYWQQNALADTAAPAE